MKRFGMALMLIGVGLLAFSVWGFYEANEVTDYLYLLFFRHEAWRIMPEPAAEQFVDMALDDIAALIISVHALAVGHAFYDENETYVNDRVSVSTRRVRRRKKR